MMNALVATSDLYAGAFNMLFAALALSQMEPESLLLLQLWGGVERAVAHG